MMSPNMLKSIAAPIPVPPMDLYRPIRRLTAKPISPIITHTNLHTQLLLNLLPRRQFIHFICCLTDQQAQHGALGREFNEGELDALIMGEGLAEGFPLVRVGYALVYAVEGCAEGGGCLADAVFVDESLGYSEAVVKGADYRGRGDPDICKGDSRVVCWHVEGPGSSC